MNRISIAGAGLAGSEAALQLAARGFSVDLYEMRPGLMTPAHETDLPAELVCSNSLRSNLLHNAPGLLKEELRRAGSFLIQAADQCAVPAGGALAVDRRTFSLRVLEMLQSSPCINLVREEFTALPGGNVIIAAGPLVSEALSAEIASLTGDEYLYFYDAIAPIVSRDSLDMTRVFRQDRYGEPGEGDYLNCPLSREEYTCFMNGLLKAEKVKPRGFEEEIHFQGCMPVEAIAESGEMSLAFGPMKPVGLTDPSTGRRPFAAVQLRMENTAGTAWNMVGFQTKLRYSEQKRVFRMIPGLENAEFLRFGSMHRNTFINGPRLLDGHMRLESRPSVMFAGQITGVEGYIESIASGFLAGVFASGESVLPPSETALGAILRHCTTGDGENYQPSNINYGLFPAVKKRVKGGKRARREARAGEALEAIQPWVQSLQRNQ